MPLRAVFNGKELIAPLLSYDEWEFIKQTSKAEKQHPVLPCCGSEAYMRTSTHGTQHFVHKTKIGCEWTSETWQHLKAKSDIVIACLNAGYSATTEVSNDAWRADVLATKDNTKVAFEVQWSNQTYEETVQRQQRYQQSGVRGCWFFRKTPPERYLAEKDLPLFQLNVDENETAVKLGSKKYPLVEFVTALLTRKVRFCEHVRSKRLNKVRIVFFEVRCWKCQKSYHVYYIHDLESACGKTIYSDQMWGDIKAQFIPEIVTEVRTFLTTQVGSHLHVGTIKKRYSKTVGENYMSFGCPYCDAICGDWYIMENQAEMLYQEDQAPAIIEKEILFRNYVHDEHPHWCFPENGEFCCN